MKEIINVACFLTILSIPVMAVKDIVWDSTPVMSMELKQELNDYCREYPTDKPAGGLRTLCQEAGRP